MKEPKVLVVDDQPANLLAFEALLAPRGHQVVTAHSGEDALRHLLHEDFAVILMDVHMPGMDGFETASLIKARPRTQTIPIIFVTATPRDVATVASAYSSGGVDFLQKPIDEAILCAKVAVFVDLGRRQEEIRRSAEELREREREALERRNARALAEIEERHRFEQERTAREAAQEAVRIRDEFLSMASHELFTPLTPLKLHIEAMRRSLANEDPLAARLDGAIRQIDRLARLVEELLYVSRLVGGRPGLEPVDVDLGGVVRDVAALFPSDMARSGSPLEVRVPEAPVVAHVDRSRTEQVLLNLLTNAFKYGRGQPVDMSLETLDDVARITVRDSGIGIPEDARARIFERFERAVSPGQYGGFGLGLWIARQIVEASGGSICVASTHGAGSTFVVDLPLSPARTS